MHLQMLQHVANYRYTCSSPHLRLSSAAVDGVHTPSVCGLSPGTSAKTNINKVCVAESVGTYQSSSFPSPPISSVELLLRHLSCHLSIGPLGVDLEDFLQTLFGTTALTATDGRDRRPTAAQERKESGSWAIRREKADVAELGIPKAVSSVKKIAVQTDSHPPILSSMFLFGFA